MTALMVILITRKLKRSLGSVKLQNAKEAIYEIEALY